MSAVSGGEIRGFRDSGVPPEGALRPRNLSESADFLAGNIFVETRLDQLFPEAIGETNGGEAGMAIASGNLFRLCGPASPYRGAEPPSAGLKIRRSLERSSTAFARGGDRTRPRAFLRGEERHSA